MILIYTGIDTTFVIPWYSMWLVTNGYTVILLLTQNGCTTDTDIKSRGSKRHFYVPHPMTDGGFYGRQTTPRNRGRPRKDSSEWREGQRRRCPWKDLDWGSVIGSLKLWVCSSECVKCESAVLFTGGWFQVLLSFFLLSCHLLPFFQLTQPHSITRESVH